ncbi:site-specific integrase [Maliponia aquimaris]|uniref:Tyrosine recombinase XerC n=1 Tax=Maliponia aquimaris TaxID=1673631 RepID=A0A238L6B3_9RHOB|nr:site-specific integrase [Maliponia aquimaris]SMX49922.1 Tyrosine recombinase XerC [Maliponia aquimaris]
MPKHRLSVALAKWPEDLRSRFEAAFANASDFQRPRLEQGLGRWLRAAAQDDLPPDLITSALIERRCEDLRPELAASMRQALQAVFPGSNAFARDARVETESKRAALIREIQRNWHRLPLEWQLAAKPKLHFCAEDLNDGLLVEAWSVDTLQSRLQSAWAFFDFCRANDLAEDVTPVTLKQRLDDRQSAFRRGAVSVATVRGEVQRLKLLGQALFPDRDWNWVNPVLKLLKKQAALQPSRNDGRLVDLAELRLAARSCSDVALRHHLADPGFRSRTSANKLARTGLALSLLVNSPIRLESLATLDLKDNFDPDLTTLYLSASETKDKKRDQRMLTPDLRCQLQDYVTHHRATVAPAQETALFVGSRGKPVAPDYLSQSVGDQCLRLFGKRVTPQVIRNIVAGFIVSQAPEQAALASEVLNHAQAATTETYRANAVQIQAAHKLREATDAGRASLGEGSPAAPKRQDRGGPNRMMRSHRAPRKKRKT